MKKLGAYLTVGGMVVVGLLQIPKRVWSLIFLVGMTAFLLWFCWPIVVGFVGWVLGYGKPTRSTGRQTAPSNSQVKRQKQQRAWDLKDEMEKKKQKLEQLEGEQGFWANFKKEKTRQEYKQIREKWLDAQQDQKTPEYVFLKDDWSWRDEARKASRKSDRGKSPFFDQRYLKICSEVGAHPAWKEEQILEQIDRQFEGTRRSEFKRANYRDYIKNNTPLTPEFELPESVIAGDLSVKEARGMAREAIRQDLEGQK